MSAWILVANGSEAHLYKSENLRTKELELIKELENPEAREKGSEIISDRAGHFSTTHAARSAYEGTDPKTIVIENFVKKLIHELKAGFDSHQYQELVLVASPHVYGLLHTGIHFVKNIYHLPKDYTKMPAAELIKHIREHLFP